MALTPAQEIRGAQEAVARRPAALGVTPIEAQILQSCRDKHAEEGLKIMAGKDLDAPVAKSVANGNLGYKDAAGNQVKNPNERAWRNRANSQIDLMDRYLTRDWATLVNADKILLVNQVANGLLTDPSMASRFATMAPAQAQIEARRIAEDYLRDGTYRAKAKEQFLQKLDPTKPLNDNLNAARAEFDKATAEELRLRPLKAALDAETTAKEAQAKEYREKPNPMPPPPMIMGTEQAKLETAKTAVAVREAQIQNIDTAIIPKHEANIRTLEQELQNSVQVATAPAANRAALSAALGNPRPPGALRAAITTEQNNINTARANREAAVTALETNKVRVTSIQEAQQRVDTELKQLKADKTKMDGDYLKATGEVTDKQRAFNKLYAESQTVEENWVKSLEGTLGELGQERVRAEIDIARAKYRELAEKEASGQVDKDKKPILELIAERNIDAQGKPDKTQIIQDYRDLLGRAVTVHVGPAPPGGADMLLNGEQQALLKYIQAIVPPPSQADQLRLMQDKTFTAEMGPKVAQKIIFDKMTKGGGLTKGEIERIRTSTWGPGMVAKAIAEKGIAQAELDAALGKGALTKGEQLIDQLKKMDWKKFMLIMLLILGLLGVTGMMAGK